MDIQIEYPHDPVRSELGRNLNWKLHSRQSKWTSIIIFILGAAFLTFSLLSGASLDDLNMLMTIGFSLLMLALLNFYSLKVTKKNYIDVSTRSASLSMQKPKSVWWRFADSGISFHGTEMKLELPWFTFTHYKIVDDFLVLIDRNVSNYCLIVDLDPIATNQKSQILELIKSKVAAI